MTTKKKKSVSHKGKIILGLTAVLTVVGVFHFKIEDIFLRTSGTCVQAIITDDIRYSSTKKDTYYFKFTANNQEYLGDSYIAIDSQTAIGTKMCIVYWNTFPTINRSIKGYFNNEFQTCDCEHRH